MGWVVCETGRWGGCVRLGEYFGDGIEASAGLPFEAGRLATVFEAALFEARRRFEAQVTASAAAENVWRLITQCLSHQALLLLRA